MDSCIWIKPGILSGMKIFTRSASILWCFLFLLTKSTLYAQPDWDHIKKNARFEVPDTTFAAPFLQTLAVPGWEDGLYITRDGKQLFSTYLPIDVFSWLSGLALDPVCFNFQPYYRPPLVGVDTVSNGWGCPNYIHADIITASRGTVDAPFPPWQPSSLQHPFTMDGGFAAVQRADGSFDTIVFTRNGDGKENMD